MSEQMSFINRPSSIWLKGALVSAGLYLLWRLNKKRVDDQKIRKLREVILNHQAEEDIQYLEPSQTFAMKDDKIQLQIQLVPMMEAKDKIPESVVIKELNQVIGDPFMPPFKKGKLVCELPPSHSLLCNKFYYVQKHLLIITKDFEDQFNPLTQEDWNQSLLLIKALRGMVFFNGGPNAGFSQRHKHIQVLPEQAFKFPLINLISQDAAQKKLLKDPKSQFYFFKGFEVVHGIAVLNYNAKGEDYHKSYIKLLSYLRTRIKDEAADYSLLAWRGHVLIVLRSGSKIPGTKSGVNSSLFLGIVMTKGQEMFDLVQENYSSPSQIMLQTCFPWPQEQ